MGRPPIPRLHREDLFYIKSQCREAGGTLSKCYLEIFEASKEKKYNNLGQPKDVRTVKSAMEKFFNRGRSLPEIYWKILDDLYGIRRQDLPSNLIASTSDEKSMATINDPEATIQSKTQHAIQPNLPDRGSQSLASWFRQIPLMGIRRIVSAAELAKNPDNSNLLQGLLSSECLNVITEKIVFESVGELDHFWNWESNQSAPIYTVLDAVFQLLAMTRPLKERFVTNMTDWLTSQSAGRICDYVYSLTHMCRNISSLQKGHLEAEIEQTISKGLAAIKPADAVNVHILSSDVEGLTCNFDALGYFRPRVELLSLFVRDDFFLAKHVFKTQYKCVLQDLWLAVQPWHGFESEREDWPNEEYEIFLKFRNFLDQNGLMKLRHKSPSKH